MKKLIVFLVVIGISLALFTRDAVAGPPWKAVVRWDDGYCGTTWLAPDLKTEVWVWGFNHDVTQTRDGRRNGSCRIQIDYSNPNYASFEDVCTKSDWAVFCNGNGSLNYGHSYKDWPMWCVDDRGILTYDTEGVATKSGEINYTCHFPPP